MAFLLHTTLPGVTLLAALIFAPWFWGCTWPLGIQILTALLYAAMAAWSLGMLLRGEKSGLPPILLFVVLLLLAQGWLMTLNARCVCDTATGFLAPVNGHITWLPGSVDQDRSRADMPRLTGLLGACVIAAWVGRSRAWRRRLLWTMTGTAVSIVLIGCIQRLTGATDIFWNTPRQLDFFFATYRNVTNAGEYLNLILPLAGALTLLAVVKRQGPLRIPGGVLAMAILATGVVISGSKMAPLVGCGSVVLFAFLQRREWPAIRVNRRTLFVTALILIGALAAIIQSVGLGVTWDRWGRLLEDKDGGATFLNRLQVDQACLLAAPDAGALGFGPGTFQTVFSYYSGGVEGKLTGLWTYAHDDYAQTLLEWGAIGATFWSLYFLGGIGLLARGVRRAEWTTEDRITGAALLQALFVVAVMAAVDFPLQIASIQFVVAVILGLAWSSLRWPRVRQLRVEKERAERPDPVNFTTRISLRDKSHVLPCRIVR